MSFTACSRILAITVEALQLIMRSVEACERCAKRPVVFEMLQNTRPMNPMRHLREILKCCLHFFVNPRFLVAIEQLKVGSRMGSSLGSPGPRFADSLSSASLAPLKGLWKAGEIQQMIFWSLVEWKY